MTASVRRRSRCPYRRTSDMDSVQKSRILSAMLHSKQILNMQRSDPKRVSSYRNQCALASDSHRWIGCAAVQHRQTSTVTSACLRLAACLIARANLKPAAESPNDPVLRCCVSRAVHLPFRASILSFGQGGSCCNEPWHGARVVNTGRFPSVTMPTLARFFI